MAKTPTTTETFIAKADGWVAGRRVRAGDELSLTPAEARYEPVEPKKAARPARGTRGETPRTKTPEPGAEAGE